jgi:hypothetical protein
MEDVFLTKEEWQRLADVPPEEKGRAFKKLFKWISFQIKHKGFDLDFGPFSFQMLGEDVVGRIATECMEALFCGEWHWNPNRELSSQLIQIAKSKMSHIVRTFYNPNTPKVLLESGLQTREDDEGNSDREKFELDVAAQWEFEANMRDMGYEMARNVVKDDPELLRYLDAMKELDNYYGIASLMEIPVNKVLNLERRLLKRLEKELKR